MRESIRLAKRYLLYAEGLDQEGFPAEAAAVSLDVARFLDGAERVLSGGKRFAIRGRSSWEDYLQTMTTGAGSGAAAGAAMGAVGGLATGGVLSAPAALAGAGTGALWGAAGGLVEKAGSDTLYNLSGNISKANALSKDFGYYADQLGKMYPEAAEQLKEVAGILKREVSQVYEAKRSEIAKQYGLDPNTSFWQNVKDPSKWGSMIGAKYRTYRSSREGAMERVAQEAANPNSSSGVSDDILKGLYNKMFGKKPAVPRAVIPAAAESVEGAAPKALAGGLTAAGVGAGIATGAAALGGGVAGYMGTDYLYGKTEDLIRGREGKERYILSEMDQIMSEIGRLLNNPNAASFMAYVKGILMNAKAANNQLQYSAGGG